MERGRLSWIRLHRQLLDNDLANDASSLSLWIHLLLMASHNKYMSVRGDSAVEILPGQVLTSRKKLALKTGLSESKIERILKAFLSGQMIEQQTRSKYRVISILKWDEYQISEQESEQHLDTTKNIYSNTTNVVLHKVGQTRKSRKKKTYKEHPQFQDWWSKYSKASASPEGSRERAAKNYLICAQDFTPDQINLATRHYLIECRKAGYSTKHGEGFLQPSLIEQYQQEPINLTDPPKQESFLDQQYKRIHGTESQPARSTAPRLESM